MIAMFLPLFFLFSGGAGSVVEDQATQVGIPAMYRIPNDSAELMIHHFRSKKVDIDDERWLNGKDKKVVRARFDRSVLGLLLGDRVTSHEFFMAAFIADGRGRTRNTPTMILRIVRNTSSASALEMEYYLPVEETLCPPPPDCNTVLQPD